MAEGRYIDPHVGFYIKAMSASCACHPVPATEVPTQQELRRSHDLGLYTVEELEDLLEEIDDTLGEWVEAHPPHVEEGE